MHCSRILPKLHLAAQAHNYTFESICL